MDEKVEVCDCAAGGLEICCSNSKEGSEVGGDSYDASKDNKQEDVRKEDKYVEIKLDLKIDGYSNYNQPEVGPSCLRACVRACVRACSALRRS